MRSSGNEESFSAGDVVGLLQDQTYMWRTDPQALLKHYWLIIKGPAGRKCLEALGFSESKSILYRRKVPETEITLLEELMKFCRLQPEGQSWKIMALFYELCHSIELTAGEERKNAQESSHLAADKARALIEGRYTQPISVGMIARQIGVTPEYLATAFRQKFGVSPHDYLVQLRLERASALLKAGVPVKEVCYSVGYRNPNYFTTLFSKKEGVTPSSLHKQARSF